MQWCWVLLAVFFLVHASVARKHYPHPHHHGGNLQVGTSTTPTSFTDLKDMDKYVVVDSQTGIQYNPYSKHHPGRHVCTNEKNVAQPVKSKQAYCKPIYKKYYVRCNGNQMCTGVRLVYETHYKDVVTTRSTNEVTYSCCPGWTQLSNRSHGCNKPLCVHPCQNGGKCVKPDTCSCPWGFDGVHCEINLSKPHCSKPCENGGKCVKADFCSCPKGFGGPQCEIDLNKPNCALGCQNGGKCVRHEVCKCPKGFNGRHCEIDIDECKEQKPCDHICYNTPGSFTCQCKEDFTLQDDGQSCRKENDDEIPYEAKDLEFEILDKRILKLETMMDESHKNDVSKNDIQSIYRDIDYISKDVSSLKTQINDVENYKNDMYVFKNKLHQIEKKAEKVDDLLLKYDKIKKCVFHNKICI